MLLALPIHPFKTKGQTYVYNISKLSFDQYSKTNAFHLELFEFLTLSDYVIKKSAGLKQLF